MILINFDDIAAGPIGTHYSHVDKHCGVMFYVGNGAYGQSTDVLMSNGNPVSAQALDIPQFALSPPNILIPAPGSANDILVHFLSSDGTRITVNSVSICNDNEGQPSRIFIEGFSEKGVSLGRTQIDGPGACGKLVARNMYFAKIYAALCGVFGRR